MKKINDWVAINGEGIMICMIIIVLVGGLSWLTWTAKDIEIPEMTEEERYREANPYTYTDILGREGRASNCYESGGFMSGGSGLICVLDNGTKIQVAQFDLTW